MKRIYFTISQTERQAHKSLFIDIYTLFGLTGYTGGGGLRNRVEVDYYVHNIDKYRKIRSYCKKKGYKCIKH